MRALIALLAVSFAWLQAGLWAGESGLPELRALQGQVEDQKKENTVLRERNQKLYAEVVDLKQGLEAVEELARNELGMIREGETYYQIVDPKPR